MHKPRTHKTSNRTRNRLISLALLFAGLILALVIWRPTGTPAEQNREAAEPATTAQPATARPASTAAATRPRRTASAPRATATASKRIFRVSWGGGAQQLGMAKADESSPEGPASFAVGPKGRAFVLDQVNSRIQIFDGDKVVKTLPLAGDTYEDIAVLKNGQVAVLDRLVRKSVSLLDNTGKVLAEVNIAGRGVPEGGALTGLFARDDGLWVEVGHRYQVRLADAQGQPDAQRPTVPGRFTADGRSLVSASLDGRFAVNIRTQPASTPHAKGGAVNRIAFNQRIANLTALESDAQGNLYLGALTMEHRSVPPYDLLAQQSLVVVMSPTGRELRRIALTAPGTALGYLRNLHVDANGNVWHLAFDPRGATLTRYR